MASRSIDSIKSIWMAVSALSCLSLFTCNSPTPIPNQGAHFPPTQPTSASIWLTQTQVDSFQLLDGKTIPQSLWSKVFVDSFWRTPVFVLSGNLDQDTAKELVLWFQRETAGQMCLLDSMKSGWKIIGTENLDFYRGNHPPCIDSACNMLVTYSYGWGSGFGAEILNFYRNQNDSLVCVFILLKREGQWLVGGGGIREISARYKFKDADQMVVTYNYRVLDGEDEPGKERIIFEKKLVIPFHWDKTKNCFIPKLPKGFPPLSGSVSLAIGESSFDPFFEPELQKIRSHGPLWKKRALFGNPDAH